MNNKKIDLLDRSGEMIDNISLDLSLNVHVSTNIYIYIYIYIYLQRSMAAIFVG
jgi:hypothetical protein